MTLYPNIEKENKFEEYLAYLDTQETLFPEVYNNNIRSETEYGIYNGRVTMSLSTGFIFNTIRYKKIINTKYHTVGISFGNLIVPVSSKVELGRY